MVVEWGNPRCSEEKERSIQRMGKKEFARLRYEEADREIERAVSSATQAATKEWFKDLNTREAE